MSQSLQVLNYMKEFGPITPTKARQEFGIERLAARIHDLRNQGYWIATVDRRSYRGRQYAEYHLMDSAADKIIAKGPIRCIG